MTTKNPAAAILLSVCSFILANYFFRKFKYGPDRYTDFWFYCFLCSAASFFYGLRIFGETP